MIDPASEGTASPASLRVLRKRPQFLALNRAVRVPAESFLLQARDRGDGDPVIGVGFTCSKKVGNAVARNRAKRRLREIARLELPTRGRQGWDYALIGRAEVTAGRAFEALRDDLRRALAKAHDKAGG
ncbi:ribonuclease P protein component [uncultured Jannaschia sp.]|uniref:ribonuclease P protein component n=1 Tax=uncultured Jannaschia sp. TaxID=293347 RepID=UPI0026162055|nr:ribonuclease P protein component [uncultured Jannaschia sp.]